MRTTIVASSLALLLIACGDDGGSGGAAGAAGRVGAAGHAGTAASGASLTTVSVSEYQRLCQRSESDELGTWLECTASDSCQSCLDELLGPDPNETCEGNIGSPAGYAAMACPWTVAMLDACFDERNALMMAISCERPPRAGDESTCLREFVNACVRTPVPDMDEPTPPPSASGCDDTCESANDDECDDGGPDSLTDGCGLGTDCADCGAR